MEETSSVKVGSTNAAKKKVKTKMDKKKKKKKKSTVILAKTANAMDTKMEKRMER